MLWFCNVLVRNELLGFKEIKKELKLTTKRDLPL